METKLGTLVAVALDRDGQECVEGVIEYYTADGWIGLRQDNGRLDEFPEAWVI